MSESKVKFINNKNSIINIYWIDKKSEEESKEVFYYTLLPKSIFVQETYISHEWIIRAKLDKQELLRFISESEYSVCNIGVHVENPTNVEVTNSIPNCDKYLEIDIAGFQVFYEAGIFEHEPRLRNHLVADLKECRRMFSLSVIASYLMKSPRIYVNKNYQYFNQQHISPCCCHWSSQWLINNGNFPEKEGCVEIYNAKSYLISCKEQPAVLFHELCHVFHWQILNHNNQELMKTKAEIIVRTYNSMSRSKKYDNVLYIYGQEIKHYALTNHIEYFAETCEAFFSSSRFRNDYYPFIHDELKLFDEDGFQMIASVWDIKNLVSDGKRLFEVICPSDYDPINKKYLST